jgi:hypothetical protein
VPLVVAEDGTRLAKRAAGVTLRDHRAAGADPRALVGRLAHALGLVDTPDATTPAALLAGFARERLAGRAMVRIRTAVAGA